MLTTLVVSLTALSAAAWVTAAAALRGSRTYVGATTAQYLAVGLLLAAAPAAIAVLHYHTVWHALAAGLIMQVLPWSLGRAAANLPRREYE